MATSLVGPELAFVGEALVFPSALHDFEGLLEAGTGLAHIDVVDEVFAGDAPDDSGDEAALGEAVHHGDFFGKAQRVLDGEDVAVNQELHATGALGCGGGHEVGGVHQAIGGGVVFVEGNAVVAKLIHEGPSFQVFPIIADRCFGPEVTLGQGIGKLVSLQDVVHLDGIADVVEDEYLHA